MYRFAMRMLVVLLLCGTWLARTTAAAHGESADARFLEGLRQRQLFALAETYCREQLQDSGLDAHRRSELTMELSQTLAARAWHTAGPQQETWWRDAVEVCREFLARDPDNPWRPLVSVQEGLVLSAQGRRLREEAELLGPPRADQRAAAAADVLRNAVRTLRGAVQEVRRRLQDSGQGAGPPRGGPRESELRSLLRHAQISLAVAHRGLANCYAADSPDQVDQLNQAVTLLAPLASLGEDEPIGWSAALELAICQRLLHQADEARQTLSRLEGDAAPPSIRLEARAQRIRLDLQRGRLAEALRAAEQEPRLAGHRSASLDFAIFEAYLAAWQDHHRAGRQNEAAAWRDRAAQQADSLSHLHGPAWGRRAENQLAAAVGRLNGSGDLDLLVRAAENQFRQGDAEAALQTYDQARQLADQLQRPQQRFELAFAAAAIEHQRNRSPQALARFRQAALDAPDHPRAAEAHLLAVFHAARQSQSGQSDALSLYRNLLAEHVRLWPAGPTADEAWWWLARLEEHQQHWAAAATAFSRVAAEHERFPEAVRGAARAWQREMARRSAADQPTDPLRQEARAWFEQVFQGGGAAAAEKFTAGQCEAALALAQLDLHADPPRAAQAYAVLRRAMAAAQEAERSWHGRATATAVMALVMDNKPQQAEALLRAARFDDPASLLALAESLRHVDRKVPADRVGDFAPLKRRLAELLEARREQLSPADRNRLDLERADALAEEGQHQQAADLLIRLAADHPRDASLQADCARRLVELPLPAARQAALEGWRRAAALRKPGSLPWLEARYWLAETHFRLGNRTQAAEILRVTQVLHPELGNPELRRRYEQLLQRCAAP